MRGILRNVQSRVLDQSLDCSGDNISRTNHDSLWRRLHRLGYIFSSLKPVYLYNDSRHAKILYLTIRETEYMVCSSFQVTFPRRTFGLTIKYHWAHYTHTLSTSIAVNTRRSDPE